MARIHQRRRPGRAHRAERERGRVGLPQRRRLRRLPRQPGQPGRPRLHPTLKMSVWQAAAVSRPAAGAAVGMRPEGGSTRTAALTPVRWSPRPDLSLADWLDCGRRFGLMGRSAGWWIGDWITYGNARYGEKYSRASRVTGLDGQTLMNMAYVASRVEPSRRRENLSWSHHAELAALSPVEQERWLDRSQRERLSVRCLREQLRLERRAGPEADPPAKSATAAGGAASQRTPVRHTEAVVCPACGHRFATRGSHAGKGGLRPGEAMPGRQD
jgi:hypothetical protein